MDACEHLRGQASENDLASDCEMLLTANVDADRLQSNVVREA